VGKDYSVGKGPAGSGTKPAGPSYDASAAAAQRREESRAAFREGQKPRITYTTPQGETRPLDAQDQRVTQIRRDMDADRWATRDARRQRAFPAPAPPAPVIVYRDPYSDWFWFWLLTQNRDMRASWAYNHRSDMDAARYRDLLAKDQQLEARIRELEAKGVRPDSTWAPPGLDSDLMYEDGFVVAAVNPQPAPRAPLPPAHARHLWGALWRILLILAIMAFLVWLVFIKRWGGT
jgi:hypothetical protein